MKHVYIFNETSKAAEYGIGTYIKQIVNSLTSQKSISLYTVNINSNKTEFEEEEDREGIRHYDIPRMMGNSKRYYRNVYFLLQPYIESNMIYKEGELVFHFNFYQNLPLIEILKEHYPGCTVIFSIHYLHWLFLIKGNRTYFQHIIKTKSDEKIVEKQVLESFNEERNVFTISDKVVCLSDYTEQLLVDDYRVAKDKIVKIYNGLKDEAVFLATENKDKLKAKYHFSVEEKIILFVGRLGKMKGINIAIKSFRQVIQKENINCRLVIAGDGDYEGCLKECHDICGKVSFIGHIDKETLYQLYQISDIGILPSFNEQCSYVVIEMLSHGIPLITSTATGLKEMTCPELQHLMVNVIECQNDMTISIDQCQRNIVSVLKESKEGMQSLRDLSRNIYLQKYTLEKMQSGILRLY